MRDNAALTLYVEAGFFFAWQNRKKGDTLPAVSLMYARVLAGGSQRLL